MCRDIVAEMCFICNYARSLMLFVWIVTYSSGLGSGASSVVGCCFAGEPLGNVFRDIVAGSGRDDYLAGVDIRSRVLNVSVLYAGAPVNKAERSSCSGGMMFMCRSGVLVVPENAGRKVYVMFLLLIWVVQVCYSRDCRETKKETKKERKFKSDFIVLY